MNEVLNGHARRKYVALAQFQYAGNGLLSLGVPGMGGYGGDFQIKTAQENLTRKLVAPLPSRAAICESWASCSAVRLISMLSRLETGEALFQWISPILDDSLGVMWVPVGGMIGRAQ